MEKLSPKIAFALAVIFLVQVLLFVSFMNREVSWSYLLHGDPTWYTYFNYRVFDALIHHEWSVIREQIATSPWGSLLFLEAAIPQFLFGASRTSAVSVNLVFYLAAEFATFWFFFRLLRSVRAGFLGLCFLLAMGTPFRTVGIGLNISDFHFDFILFSFLLILYYLVAWSNSFLRLGPSLILAGVAAFIVANRLVSVFLFVGIFGAFGAMLLFLYLKPFWFPREITRVRLKNFFFTTGVFLGISAIPIYLARGAFFGHYFRFVFDPEFKEARKGLYEMGASTKWLEAQAIIERIVKYDFGIYFGVALLSWILVVAGTRTWQGFFSDYAGPQTSDEDFEKWNLHRLAATRSDWTLFLIFLWLAAGVSYLEQLVFPVKSDHLTRMTSAPLLIFFTIMASVGLMRLLANSRMMWRGLGIAALGITAGCAILTQISFYTGPGRSNDLRQGHLELERLYGDLSRIIHRKGLKEVAFSVDVIKNYELGALMSYFSYEYETNGVLLYPAPKLGGVIDEPITIFKAQHLLDASDFILWMDDPYPKDSFWPFSKSVATFHPELTTYTKEHFCFVGNYRIFGDNKKLFVNPSTRAWAASASASTTPQYGPEGLLSSSGTIWHAPWDGKTPQWVEFASPDPVRLEGLSLMAQDKAPDRAPRDFVLQANLDGHSWVDLLTVRGADFSQNQTLEWTVRSDREYRVFRLWVTANNGNSGLMTIQGLKVNHSQKCTDLVVRSHDAASVGDASPKLRL